MQRVWKDCADWGYPAGDSGGDEHGSPCGLASSGGSDWESDEGSEASEGLQDADRNPCNAASVHVGYPDFLGHMMEDTPLYSSSCSSVSPTLVTPSPLLLSQTLPVRQPPVQPVPACADTQVAPQRTP